MIDDRVMPKRSSPGVASIVHDLKIVPLTNAPPGQANWTGRFTHGPDGFGAAIDAVAAVYDLDI